MHNLSVGQKVVCIDDSPSTPETMINFVKWVKKDETYTIRSIRPAGAEGGILLDEVKNPPVHFPHFGGNLEPAFHPRRFVSLQTKEKVREKVKEVELEEELV